MVIVWLDRLLALLASLKLAIVVILSLAVFLAIATFYESRYGAPAVQRMVYGSPVFVVILAMLAINVAAAAIVRFPWKRKQTGFVITHVGIEVLLIGCVISMRQSIDGVVVMQPGQTIEHVNLRSERLWVAFGDPKQPHRRSFAADWWEKAYPGVAGYLVGAEPSRSDYVYTVNDSIKVSVDEWLPASRLETGYVADESGMAALKIRLHGRTPAGQAQDESVWLDIPKEGGRLANLFGGVIETAFWPARSDAEVEAFQKPLDLETLGDAGRLRIFAGDLWHELAAGDVGREITLGGTGIVATVMGYYPAAVDDMGQIINADPAPTNPYAVIRIKTSQSTDDYAVSARYPWRTRRETSTTKSTPTPLTIVFDHPAVFRTQPAGTRGRVQIVQSPSGELYVRQFGLRGFSGTQPMKVGQDVTAFMGMKLVADEYLPKAKFREEIVRENRSPNKMADAVPAAKVTVEAGGEEYTRWLVRGDQPQHIDTAAGPVVLTYTWDGAKLPFVLSLVEATMTRDPGSRNPATFESKVRAVTEDGQLHEHTITMNEPATIAGLTFYQQGFTESTPGGPRTQLSVRHDAGWQIKYAGCGLIVLGIFTMFYMKAYFAKPAAAPVRRAKADPLPKGGLEVGT